MTHTLAATAAALLLQHGPLTAAELHALAVEAGATTAKTDTGMKRALQADTFVVRPDGSYDTAARLLRGQTFTTRVHSVVDDTLWTYRDLDPLQALPHLPLHAGGEVTRGRGEVEAWVGPPGWLSGTTRGELLALRWDGQSLHTDWFDENALPEFDSDAVRNVREVLSRHARAELRYGWSSVPRTSLTRTVVSALVEQPRLFADPLPPLRELLPLPEDLRPSDSTPGMTSDLHAIIVEVPLPRRVHDELSRRADRIGELFPHYLALLLGAAADRVQLAQPSYARYEPYVGDYADPGGDVIRINAWNR